MNSSFRNMPVKSTNYNSCFQTVGHVLLPIGIASTGWYFFLKRPGQQQWFQNLRVPNWYTTNPLLAEPITIGCLGLLGYGARLALKEARGDDRRLALGLYGATLAAYAAVSIPTTLFSKNIKQWAAAFGLVSALVGSTAFAFYKINNTAGLLLVPFSAWYAYNSLAMFFMEDEKPKVA